MAWAIVARRALSPSTPRAQGAPLRASGVDRSARPSKWLSCQQCEGAPLGLPRSIFNRHPPEVSITEICYQFRVSHMGCSPEMPPLSQEGHTKLGTPKPAVFAPDAATSVRKSTLFDPMMRTSFASTSMRWASARRWSRR